MILYGTLVLCALGAAFIVYRNDLYDREPAWLLGLTAGLGAAAMWLAGFVESWTLEWSGLTSRAAIAALAAIVEETAKVLVVAGVALSARKAFNDPLDGLIYGSLAGLGMAVEESVAYLRAEPPGPWILPPVELVRLCGHLVMGGIGAFALGMAATGRRAWPFALVGGLVAATSFHFAWDWLALSVADARELSLGNSVLGVVLMVAGLALYGTLTAIGSKWSHGLFAPDRPARLWGWPFNRAGRK
ncbi:MAG TPA: PrsW family glutamic-type intramembrane protease, partial [Vicinamibacteria bacterium]